MRRIVIASFEVLLTIIAIVATVVTAVGISRHDQHRAELVQAGVFSGTVNRSGPPAVASRTSSPSADPLVLPADSSWKKWPSVTDF